MSFPKIELGANCNSCGSSVSSCSCDRVSQTTIPMQSLPKPTVPLNSEDVPDKYVSSHGVIWTGAENPTLGIYPGDSLTKIINILENQTPDSRNAITTLEVVIAPGGDFSYIILSGYLLTAIVIEPVEDAIVTIGLTEGGNEVCPEQGVTQNAGNVISVGIYAKAADTILYLAGLPAGSKVVFIKNKIK